ncbi:MAG: DUF3575 domain-containing protein [Chitinophagaceae bacterium]|nr:DUF3575 domain-containing protein [Chitinophagaceae bacterium]
MKPLFVKTVVAIFFMLSAIAADAQSNSHNSDTEKSNILKLNIPALFFKNFSLQYERKLSPNHSFALGLRYRPAGNIPFKKTVEDIVDDPSIRVDLAKIGNLGITAEYRFYLGKKGVLSGFYIAPLISYNHYNGDVPVNYYDYVNNVTIDKTATFKGSVNAFTAGFQLGAQWKLSEKIYLDWWIVGPNYGISNGHFDFIGQLNDIEQISLQYELEKIKQTIPLIKIELDGKPDANGAAFNVKGPWAGVRALGINLGYRF